MSNICKYCGPFEGGGGSGDLREHYKTLFHRYNFERCQRGLKGVTESEFESVLNTFGKEDDEEENSYCSVCSKQLKSTKALLEHTKTKTHLKQAKKMESRNIQPPMETTPHTAESEHSSDYEDIDENEICAIGEVNFQCVFCDTRQHETLDQLQNHIFRDHQYAFPVFVKSSDLCLRFTEQYVKWLYEYFCCVRCGKIFLCSNHLLNHIHDTQHYMHSDDFLREFVSWMKKELDSDAYANMIRIRDERPFQIDQESMCLITKGRKVLSHRKNITKLSQCRDDLIIIPKAHFGLKKLNELLQIPFDYESALATVCDEKISKVQLKAFVLDQLSRKGYFSTTYADRRDKLMNAALRTQKKLQLDVGVKSNKIPRALPKKLMYL